MYRVNWIGSMDQGHTASTLDAAKKALREEWRKAVGPGPRGELRCVAYRDAEYLGGFWLRY